MKEFVAYQIINDSMADVVALWCNTLYQHGQKASLVFDSVAQMQECDKKIWTFSSEKFIPHSTILDQMDKTKQFFYLTDRLSDAAAFPNIALVFQDDNIDLHAEMILKVLSMDFVDKISYIFTGIDDSKKYFAQITKTIDKNVFSGFKFFSRLNGTWTSVN